MTRSSVSVDSELHVLRMEQSTDAARQGHQAGGTPEREQQVKDELLPEAGKRGPRGEGSGPSVSGCGPRLRTASANTPSLWRERAVPAAAPGARRHSPGVTRTGRSRASSRWRTAAAPWAYRSSQSRRRPWLRGRHGTATPPPHGHAPATRPRPLPHGHHTLPVGGVDVSRRLGPLFQQLAAREPRRGALPSAPRGLPSRGPRGGLRPRRL